LLLNHSRSGVRGRCIFRTSRRAFRSESVALASFVPIRIATKSGSHRTMASRRVFKLYARELLTPALTKTYGPSGNRADRIST
jgi:hypothetical protein